MYLQVVDKDPDYKIHVTWCLTGPLTFLPLHAAGIYEPNDSSHMNIFDIAVSSYAPTLTSLLHPPAKSVETSGSLTSLLVISQPETPGQKRLPGTVKEAATVLKSVSAKNALHLNNEKATIEDVLQGMAQYDWVHLACHGSRTSKIPSKAPLLFIMASSTYNYS